MSNSPHQPPSALTKLQNEYAAERYGGSRTQPLQAPALEITGVHGTRDLHDSCQTCNVSRAHGCEHLEPRSAGSVNPTAAIGSNNGFTAQVPRNQYENPRPNYTRLDGPRGSTWTLSDEVLPPTAGGGIGKGMDISSPMAFPHTTIFLQPIAAPQALGMAAWSATSFVFGAWLAEWYGTDATGLGIFPFFIFGGVAQFAAGMWSFRSRDTLASVVHTMWACFWLAIGFYYATRPAIAIAVPNQPNTSTRWYHLQAFAIWMVPIAAFTWIAAMASLLRDLSQTLILSLMATGSTLTVIGWFSPSIAVTKIGAYFWLVGALLQLFRVFVYFLHENKKTHAEDGLLPRYHRRESHWRDDWRRGYASPHREPGVVHGDGW